MSRKPSLYRSWSPDRPVKPDVDPMLTGLRSELRGNNSSTYAKANMSGLSPTTIKRIEKGITKRPQSVTVQMLYHMLGYELVPKRITKRD